MILSYRISARLLQDDEQFEQLLRLLKVYPSAIDEVSLFTEYWHHGYFPLDEFADWAALLGRRLEQLRKAGIGSVGINMLCTIGHLDEAWDFLPPWPLQVMIGHDGTPARGSACPNSPEFREYIKQKYKLIAKAGPDFIWVDDDIRMSNHTIPWGCFCPICIEKFGHDIGSREELMRKLDDPQEQQLRVDWVSFNCTTLREVLADIGEAVRSVDSGIDVGLMHYGPIFETTYNGSDPAGWMRALGGKRLRPGGGFYDDEAPRGMVRYKALNTARHVLSCPPHVDNIQYELENFPYQKLGKSNRIMLDECVLALMAGCNGVAFNMLKDLPGDLADYHERFRAIECERPFWETVVEACQGLPMAGLWSAYHEQMVARRTVREGERWLECGPQYYFSQTHLLAEIGIPLTADRRAACGTILNGRITEAFTDDELREMLSGGMLLDAAALAILWERGLGELTGVKPGKSYDNGVYEQFTDHPLNGRYAGDARDARLSFWNTQAVELVPVADGVGDMARLVGYDDSDCGMCLTAYENKLGGRIITASYAPWTRLESSAKRTQMTNCADWITRNRLPVLIDRTVRVAPFIRMSEDGRRFVALLLNTGYDETCSIDVRFRGIPPNISILTPQFHDPAPVRKIRGESVVSLSNLPPWHPVVVIGK